MKYAYSVYTNSRYIIESDVDYYLQDMDFSYEAFQGLWIPNGVDYQGFICIL